MIQTRIKLKKSGFLLLADPIYKTIYDSEKTKIHNQMNEYSNFENDKKTETNSLIEQNCSYISEKSEYLDRKLF